MAWPAIIAGISAGMKSTGDLFGAYKQRQHERYMAEKNLRLNKELADYGYSQELEQWNRANLYNSPQEQMKRLQMAGLNPNLVYGRGIENVSVKQLPRYNAPTADFSKVSSERAGIAAAANAVGNVANQYFDIKQKAATIDRINAMTEHEIVRKLFTKRKSVHEVDKREKTFWDMASIRARAKMQKDLLSPTGKYQFNYNQKLVDMMYQRLLYQMKEVKWYGFGRGAQLIQGMGRGALGFKKGSRIPGQYKY